MLVAAWRGVAMDTLGIRSTQHVALLNVVLRTQADLTAVCVSLLVS